MCDIDEYSKQKVIHCIINKDATIYFYTTCLISDKLLTNNYQAISIFTVDGQGWDPISNINCLMWNILRERCLREGLWTLIALLKVHW